MHFNILVHLLVHHKRLNDNHSNTTLYDMFMAPSLCYKSEGCGFDSRWCHWNFHWHNPSGRTMALTSTQTLTEMRTRNISWGSRRPVC